MVADQGTDFSMVPEPSRCSDAPSSGVRGELEGGGWSYKEGGHIGAAGWQRGETTFNFYPFQH